MSKYSKKNNISEQTKEDALKIARGTQKPGQTKEQTKLIARGIEKGIELYKKKHKEKSRELDKQLSKAKASKLEKETSTADINEAVISEHNGLSNKLPWLLLVLSWACFVIYVYMTRQ